MSSSINVKYFLTLNYETAFELIGFTDYGT